MATKTAAKSAAKSAPTPTKNVPAVSQGGPMVVESGAVPDYIKNAGNRGSENVGMDDIAIPRLEIVQGLSPAIKPNDPGYIEGAKLGDLINSVTRQVYHQPLMVVPVYYTKQWLVWKDQNKGGGFFGAYPNPQEAKERADQEGGEKNFVQVIDTPQHLCLVLNSASGKAEEIMISMPRTKSKISRQWNSMVKLIGGDRFGRVYGVGTAGEKNEKGDYYNFTVAQSGFPSQRVYQQAEQLYSSIAAGDRQVVMSTDGLDATTIDGEDSEM